MPVKAKYIKDLPLKKVLDGSESLLVQDLNGTQQAPLGTIVDEIKQNSQEKIREIKSELAQTNAQLSQIDNKKISQHEPNSISIEMLNTQVKDLLTVGDKVAVVGGNSVSMAQFATSIQEDIGEYVEKEITEETGFYVGNVGSKLSLAVNSTFQHNKIPVSEGEKYLITCGVGEQEGFACVWFVDSATGLISKSKELINTTGGTTRFEDSPVVVPNGAGLMIVQGQKAIKAFKVKKLMYTPIATKKEIKPIADKVKEIKLNATDTTRGKNLYDVYNKDQTDYSKRVIVNLTNNNYSIIDNTNSYWSQVALVKIFVDENVTYSRNQAYHSDANICATYSVVCVNESGKGLASFSPDTTNSNEGLVTFTTPPGTKYILTSVYKNYIDKFVFCEGFVASESTGVYQKTILPSTKIEYIQPYWKELIDKKSREILNQNIEDVKICFFTDNHMTSNVTKYGAGDIIDYLDKQIGLDNVVFGGDLLMDSYSSKDGVADDIRNFRTTIHPFKHKLLSCQGNHETYYKVNGIMHDMTEHEVYSILRVDTQKGCVNSPYSSLTYYYDDMDRKIRYIVLEWRPNYSDEIPTFVYDTLKDLDNKNDASDWVVLFVIHFPFLGRYDELFKGVSAIANKTSYTNGTFSINNGGKYQFNNRIAIAGVISGHTHHDWHGTNFGYNGEDIGINFFISCADAMLDREDDKKLTMAKNDIYNHTLNVIMINKEKRTVTVERLGGYKCRTGYEWDGISRRKWEY